MEDLSFYCYNCNQQFEGPYQNKCPECGSLNWENQDDYPDAVYTHSKTCRP